MLTRFFNVILALKVVPEQWSIGVIKPIYTTSGDDTTEVHLGHEDLFF